MAYQTLYRKYRPKSFELVYGQDNIVKTLKNVIKNEKLSHAYLFTGPRGTGKTSSAKLFAKAINCLNNKNGDACNECENCESFNKNNNPDIIEIDAASNNGVDEIREIRNKVNLVPSISKYKVYIIDEVHMLSMGAFNALLKTLEEPPEYIIFILATTEPQKLPATVISRCQRFDFKSISKTEMKKCLKNIIDKENINIEDNALDEIVDISNGGMRDAIGLLDQSFAFSDDIITLKDIQDLSGSIATEDLIGLLKNIISQNIENVFKQIQEWSEEGKDFFLISQKIINFLRMGILYKKNIKQKDIDELLEKTYKEINENTLYLMLENFNILLNKISETKQKELIFEIEIIKMLNIINVDVPRETLKKIENKETDVPRETLKEIKNKEANVPRETLEKNNLIKEKIKELKDIRINNILKMSSKQKMNFIDSVWDNLNEFLIEEKYKNVTGALLESKIVAVSQKGIIITTPTENILKKLEKDYDYSKELIKQITNNDYKIVYITNEYWKKIRPDYVEKVRNGQLEIKDEEYILSQIKKIKNENSVMEFDELIEMEEK